MRGTCGGPRNEDHHDLVDEVHYLSATHALELFRAVAAPALEAGREYLEAGPVVNGVQLAIPSTSAAGARR